MKTLNFNLRNKKILKIFIGLMLLTSIIVIPIIVSKQNSDGTLISNQNNNKSFKNWIQKFKAKDKALETKYKDLLSNQRIIFEADFNRDNKLKALKSEIVKFKAKDKALETKYKELFTNLKIIFEADFGQDEKLKALDQKYIKWISALSSKVEKFDMEIKKFKALENKSANEELKNENKELKIQLPLIKQSQRPKSELH